MFAITLVLGIIAISYSYREHRVRIDNRDYVIRTLIHECTVISNVVTSTFVTVEDVFEGRRDKVSIGDSARFFDKAHNKIYLIRETMHGTITSEQFNLFLNFANSAEGFMVDVLGLNQSNANDSRMFLENDIKNMVDISTEIQQKFYHYFSEGRNLSFTLHIPNMKNFIRQN